MLALIGPRPAMMIEGRSMHRCASDTRRWRESDRVLAVEMRIEQRIVSKPEAEVVEVFCRHNFRHPRRNRSDAAILPPHRLKA